LLAHSARFTEYPLPSYSPDYNPIEYLSAIPGER
jgi:transposase